MRDALAGLLMIFALTLILMPREMGQSARTRYDQFMAGWNNPDAPRETR